MYPHCINMFLKTHSYRFRSLCRPFILATTLAIIFPFTARTQTTQATFGKNRVQYHRHLEDWMYYETPNFVTYWYGDARNVAQAALQTAEADYGEIQRLLEHQTGERIDVIVFSDLTDLKQSNIGESEVFDTKIGETKVIGNTVFVYYNGDHRHLRRQLREGMAGVLLNSMLYGSNLQEIVQNAVLLNLPEWFTSGLLTFCGEEWNIESDNALKDLLLSGNIKNFDKLAKEQPKLAGHAFWNYVSLHFGIGTVNNLLYLTRINRSIESGFLYVLGGGYKRTTSAVMDYYTGRYQEDQAQMAPPTPNTSIKIKNKRNLPLLQLKISPDGQKIAWVSHDIGKWKVYIQDLKTGKRKRILKGGMRNGQQAADLNYPLLAWSPDNQHLEIIYEKRDKIKSAEYTLQNRKIKRDKVSPEYQRIYSVDYLNPATLIFSAEVKGYSDIFSYNMITRQSDRITQDFWDDLDVKVVHLDGEPGILWSSNRIADTLALEKIDTVLPLTHFDLYYMNLSKKEDGLVRITQTPLWNEYAPIEIDSAFYGYLSDESGITNRQIGFLEPYTAYWQSIIYLKNGAAIPALAKQSVGEWPLERVRATLPPLDSVLVNIDSTTIDSIRTVPVIRKKAVTHNQTNYDRNLLSQSAAGRSGQMVESIWRNQKTEFHLLPIDTAAAVMAPITRYRQLSLQANPMETTQKKSKTPTLPPGIDKNPRQGETGGVTLTDPRDSIAENRQGWQFQMPEHLQTQGPVVEKSPDTNVIVFKEDNAEDVDEEHYATEPFIARKKPEVQPIEPVAIIRFNPSKIIPYRLKFRTDYITTNMDNSLLFEGLESYSGSPNGFQTPPPGILAKANFKDLMEDYVLEAGFRLPTTFDGAEYYIWFDDKKYRFDKRYALYRRTNVDRVDIPGASPAAEPGYMRTNTVLGQFELRYPFDQFFSLRGMFSARQDRAILQSTDRTSLETPDFLEQRMGVRISAVYDNTVDVDVNLKTGTRAKLFVENVKKFAFNIQPDVSLKFNNGIMTIIGLDARHYHRLDKKSILAMRLAAATSFGSEKILYFLGGVENWLFPQFDNKVPVPADNDFAFQTLAANVRGFKQNIRNGNSFALFNMELRVPVFKYFSKKPVLGNFWRNFQVIGFFDTGTAWQGFSPYSGQNPLNTLYAQNAVITAKVNYFRDPLVAGFGVGARAMLFGMFLRADYGWGFETRELRSPVFHLALGTDF